MQTMNYSRWPLNKIISVANELSQTGTTAASTG